MKHKSIINSIATLFTTLLYGILIGIGSGIGISIFTTILHKTQPQIKEEYGRQPQSAKLVQQVLRQREAFDFPKPPKPVPNRFNQS